MPQSEVHRREFLKTTAAGAAALSLTAASAKRVLGANDRINVAFLGTGGRCQAHIKVVNYLKGENKGVAPVAVCDVCDGNKEKALNRGLYPSAEKCNLNAYDATHVTKDYRRIPVDQQCEVLSLLGDVAEGADGPILHVHVVLGLSDGTTRGGHLLEGRVFPTLEVVVTETPAELRKVMRPDIGIALIDLDQSQA